MLYFVIVYVKKYIIIIITKIYNYNIIHNYSIYIPTCIKKILIFFLKQHFIQNYRSIIFIVTCAYKSLNNSNTDRNDDILVY